MTLQLSINPGTTRHSISPLIYGINATRMSDTDFAELTQAINPTIVRWGGNITTRYNWENDFYNTAKDWYYENIPFDNPDRSKLPDNSAADRFIQRNRNAAIESLITVPIIGWVAKAKNGTNPLGHPYNAGFKVSKYGPQQLTDPYDPDCGNGIRPDSSLITGNDPTDTSIAVNPDFVRRWVSHLAGKFGNASAGGVRFYGLDNEPGIWYSTHRDVYPGYLSYQELLQRNIDYATAIRQADPSAQILGPVQDGWMRYFYSSYGSSQIDTIAQQDRNANNGMAFVAWYLTKLYEREQQTGQRTIDYFDLHYYPQAASVALSSAGDSATQALRLRTTRSLWDTSYVDESWIKNTGTGNVAVQLIPRMRAWVNQHYPGLKLAVTEYNWGAIDTLNGALAQADVLGIFGRENVGLANLWATKIFNKQPALTANLPVAFAFRMYRNYDGQGNKFGDISISATSADQGQLAIYAAQRSGDRALTVMIINKSDNDLPAVINLGGFVVGGSAQHYYYGDATQLVSIAKRPDLPISNGAINATFAAKSINLLIIPASV